MQNSDTRITFSSQYLLGLLGFAFLGLWICSFFLDAGPLYFCKNSDRVIGLGIFMLCCAGFFVLFRLVYDKINTVKALRTLLITNIMLIVVYEFMAFFTVMVVVASCIAVLTFLYWMTFLCQYDHPEYTFGATVAFIGIALSVITFLVPFVSFIVCQILPVVSAVCLLALFLRSSDDWVSVSKEQSDSIYVISPYSFAINLFDGILTGIALCLVFFDGSLDPVVLSIVALILGILGLLEMIVRLKGAALEDRMLGSYLLRVTPFVLLLPFLTGSGINICAGGLLLVMSINVFMILYVQMEQTRFSLISAICVFGSGMARLCAGGVIGWCAGMAIVFFNANMYVRAAILYCVFFGLIIANTFLFKNQFPEADIGTLESGTKVSDAEMFATAVATISEANGLSPRQKEVFALLARGRNSEYISKQFFISKSTAKAHINSIYKKLGIHSQQELINMVDDIL